MSLIKCKAGKQCICKGLSVKEKFDYFAPQLLDLQDASITRRQQVLNDAHPCLVQLICEIGLNILKGNIELPGDQYKDLKPYKRLLLSLCQPGKSLAERKKGLLKAARKLLPKILPVVLTAISSFAGHALANASY
jgi:hypothetical protein